jgi:hypothetical protein
MANAKVKPSFQEYDASGFKLGMKFTAPVYFDDGENMFLAENCPIKPYHLQAVKQWGISVVLTFGKLTNDSPQFDNAAAAAGLRGASLNTACYAAIDDMPEEPEELREV